LVRIPRLWEATVKTCPGFTVGQAFLPVLVVEKETDRNVCPTWKIARKDCCKNLQARVDCCESGNIIATRRYFAPHIKIFVGGKNVPTGTCPECEADVHVDTDTDKGESVSCEECGVELEVVGLDPVELDIVEEEDLDDDEDEDDF
jgi:alpha-aminoadipate carrier protein LysW